MQMTDEHKAKMKAAKRPDVILDPLQKAQANPKSLRAAINAKCYECCCEQRTEVKLCQCKDCPLFALRPWQNKSV